MKNNNRLIWIFSMSMFILLIILLCISKEIYWSVVIPWLICQTISNLIRDKIEKKTRYKNDYHNYDDEILKLMYVFFIFPVVWMFPNYFRKWRKESYYKYKYAEYMKIKKEGFVLTVKSEEELEECILVLRQIKLKKIKNRIKIPSIFRRNKIDA